jgi:hypothetical protein
VFWGKSSGPGRREFGLRAELFVLIKTLRLGLLRTTADLIEEGFSLSVT